MHPEGDGVDLGLGKQLSRRQFTQRMVAAGLGITALPSLLAACGGGGSDDDGDATSAGTAASTGASAAASGEKVSLEYWKFDDSPPDDTIKAAIKRFNQTIPNIQVNLRVFPFEDYVNGTKLPSAFAAGQGPDVFWVSASLLLDYVNNGIAADMDDVIGEQKSLYSQAAIDSVTFDGKMKAVPFEQTPVGLFYRPDFLEEAGIQPPKTLDDLVAAAKELTTSKRAGIVIEPAPGAYGTFTWYPFLWSSGGEVVNADWTESALRTPEAAKAFDVWGQLVRDGSAPKKLPAGSADIGPLARGECAMQVCGFWAVQVIGAQFKGLDYGVVPIPAATGKDPVAIYGGWMQVVNGKSDKVEAAKAFTRWQWVEDSQFPHDWSCVANTQYSTRSDIRDSCASVFTGPGYDEFGTILPFSRAEPHYPSQMTQGVTDGLQSAMFGGKSGEDAAGVAADAIDSFLASYQGVH